MDLSVLAIVPARGGSKGLPRKNIRFLGGKPLLAHTLEAAGASGVFQHIVISTDDVEIAECGRLYGGEVPFMRPSELAGDASPTLPVLQHAVRFYMECEGWTPDLVVVLQPTSPLRSAEDIRAAVQLLSDSPASTSVISVCETEHSPYWMRRIDSQGHLISLLPTSITYNRRQDLPPTFRINGALYVVRTEVLMQGRLSDDTTKAYIMPGDRSVDIDTELDFFVVEWMLQGRGGSA